MMSRFLIITLAMPAMAHSDSGNYGSDIPESLMWLLSFFLLIGFLFVVGSYFMVPDPVAECDRERVTYLRILPEDLDRLAKRLNDHKNKDQTQESSA